MRHLTCAFLLLSSLECVCGALCVINQLNQRPAMALLVGCLPLLLASGRHPFTKGLWW